MSNLLHQFNDPSLKTLVGLSSMNSWALPLIKTANVDQEFGDSLPDSAYAWEDRRMFPIDSPENALVSKLYIEKQASQVPSFVKEAVDGALMLYGVEPRDITVELQTKEASNVQYVFPRKKRWAVTDEDSYKLAEEALVNGTVRLPFVEKVAAAVEMCKIAAVQGRTPSMGIIKAAGAVVSDHNKTIDWLEVRANIATGSTARAYVKLAGALANEYPVCHDHASLVKIAGLIEVLDRKAGIDKQYGSSVPDPVATVFNTSKIAEETFDVGGKPVPLSRLAKLPEALWEQLLGPDVKEVMTDGAIDAHKLSDVIPTLPKDIQIVLSRYV